jgi:transposase-like protein
MDSDAALVGWGTPLRANIDETVLLVVITEQGENRNQCEEQRNLFGSPTVLPAAERREAERSEADRSAAAGKTVAPEPLAPPRPDPEVVANAKRRTFTAESKLRILAEADAAAAQPGAIGALQRREGLYSSHLVTWRREREAGMLKGLTPHKRGPKSKRNPQDEEMEKLRRENQRLTEQLRKAEIVIDVQKKVGALLGWPLPKADPEEKP